MATKNRFVALATGIAAGLATQALAGTAFYNGTLDAGDMTFDNPDGSGSGSGIHFYEVQEFTVDLTGAYTFEAASPNATGTPSNALDTFLRVYVNSFNPASPATNSIAFDDDFTGTLSVLPGPYAGTVAPAATGFAGAQPGSQILNLNLTAGTTYFVVSTSFRQTNFVGTGTTAQSTGDYYIGIGGVGNITLIPAPGAFALLGVAGLASRRRRRTA